MNLNFDAENVNADGTTFGVGRDYAGNYTFVEVPVNEDVKAVLRQMMGTTVTKLEENADQAEEYNPAEKYGSMEHLDVSIDSALAEVFRHLHDAVNLNLNANLTGDREQIFCYFARFLDSSSRRLTALRRAGQFKSLGKANRLVSIVDDSLRIVNNPLFKLD